MASKKLSKSAHIGLIVFAAILLVGTVGWLVAYMHISLTVAAAMVTVGLAVIGGLYWWADRKSDSNAVTNDRTYRVEPILQNYREDHNKKRLLREYDAWSQGIHDPELHQQFLMDVITLLVNDRHNTEAGMRLAELDEMAVTDAERAQAKAFREKVEAKIRENQAARAAQKDAE